MELTPEILQEVYDVAQRLLDSGATNEALCLKSPLETMQVYLREVSGAMTVPWPPHGQIYLKDGAND